jgi:hypothetical protein
MCKRTFTEPEINTNYVDNRWLIIVVQWPRGVGSSARRQDHSVCPRWRDGYRPREGRKEVQAAQAQGGRRHSKGEKRVRGNR